MWKIISELYPAIRLNKPALVRLFDFSTESELAKHMPAFGDGWDSATARLVKAIRQWTKFFSLIIHDDMAAIGPPEQSSAPTVAEPVAAS